jgi:hypothetical protein
MWLDNIDIFEREYLQYNKERTNKYIDNQSDNDKNNNKKSEKKEQKRKNK